MKVRENPIGFLIMLALAALVAVVGCGPVEPTIPTPLLPTATSAPPSAAAPAATVLVDDRPTETPEPGYTPSQANAVKKARSYLDYSSFSKKGLVHQLEYEGFSNADATYAVDNITVDWAEQAARKAKEYLAYSAFSKSGLLHQLKYEGFTDAEAKHGVEATGL